MTMITKASLAVLTILALSAPALAQERWAPWVANDAPAPIPEMRTVPQPQRVAAQTPRAQTPAPVSRVFNFEHFWVVGSFR